jgi:hypothetical protein
MRLTRIVVRKRSRDHRVFADYKTPEGRRVRLILGNAGTKKELLDLVQKAAGALPDRQS